MRINQRARKRRQYLIKKQLKYILYIVTNKMYNIYISKIFFTLMLLKCFYIFSQKSSVKHILNNLYDFLLFVSENNPLILDYSDYIEADKKVNNNEEVLVITKPQEKFEDKYLEKFKKFPNEYTFTEEDLEFEKHEFDVIKRNVERERTDKLKDLNGRLAQINNIQNKGNINNSGDGESFTKNINQHGINVLVDYFNLEEDYNENPEDVDLEELYMDLLNEKVAIEKALKELEDNIQTDEDFKKEAREAMINNKLNKFINNYVMEHTPLGNIYMRYNNDKKSFEYFSNSTIPYRYLEPVGRKYVTTFWCKPIFIDIEDELKKADEKYEDDKKKAEEDEKKRKMEIWGRN